MTHFLGLKAIDSSRGFLVERKGISTFDLPNWFKPTLALAKSQNRGSLFPTSFSFFPFYFLQLAATFAACK